MSVTTRTHKTVEVTNDGVVTTKFVIPSRDVDDIPDACEMCKNNRALTGSGKLWRLVVDTPTKVYCRYICDECVEMFNTRWFPSLTKLIRLHLRTRRYGLSRP